MSDEFFPLDLPGTLPKLRRRQSFDTKVLTTRSRVEHRASWSLLPIYTYTVEWEVLNRDDLDLLNTDTEILWDFHARHRGRYASFLIVDPEDGAERRVRFASDDLDHERIVDVLWRGEPLDLVSLKAGTL